MTRAEKLISFLEIASQIDREDTLADQADAVRVNVSELGEKVQKSIDRLRAFSPKDDSGYYLAFSGGKDSVVCKALLDMAGVKYDSTYRVTSVDPPELVRFIRDKHPDVKREVPVYGTRRGPEWEGKPVTMWNLIPWKIMPPTRLVRYCCDWLKESGGDGRMTVTGVRWCFPMIWEEVPAEEG